jgi:hypothetical protein
VALSLRRITRTSWVMLSVPFDSIVGRLSMEEAFVLAELGSGQLLVEDLADVTGRPLKEVIAILHKAIGWGVVALKERRKP